MGITILEGDFSASQKVSFEQGGISYYENLSRQIIPKPIFAPVQDVEFLGQNNVTQGGGFSPLWGAIGLNAIGPLGLFLGEQEQVTNQFVTFRCTLQDGRYFIGATSGKEYQKIRYYVSQPPITKQQRFFTSLVIWAVILTCIITFIAATFT